MKIDVSNGEILDKISILLIKQKRIKSPDKLANINKELRILSLDASNLLDEFSDEFALLLDVNSRLWDIEDRIRDFERKQDFSDAFIKTARSVYRNNDERAAIKKRINNKSGSDIVEEKSYKAY